MLAVPQVFFTGWQRMLFRPFSEQVKRPGVAWGTGGFGCGL